MSTLLVSECKPSTYQKITADKNMFLVALRPHLYIHGNPSGDIKVQVQDANGVVISESSSETIANIKVLAEHTEDYVHGYFRFYINANLVDQSQYRLAIVGSNGYSFSESDYVGVCLDWDNTKSNLGYSPANSFSYPLDIEIWERAVK